MIMQVSLGTRGWCVVVFGLAILPRVLAVLLWPTMAHTDEIFQSVERAHWLVFGYGVVPWEFEHGARSWLLTYVCAGLIRFSLLFGESPALYMAVIGVAFSLLSGPGAFHILDRGTAAQGDKGASGPGNNEFIQNAHDQQKQGGNGQRELHP